MSWQEWQVYWWKSTTDSPTMHDDVGFGPPCVFTSLNTLQSCCSVSCCWFWAPYPILFLYVSIHYGVAQTLLTAPNSPIFFSKKLVNVAAMMLRSLAASSTGAWQPSSITRIGVLYWLLRPLNWNCKVQNPQKQDSGWPTNLTVQGSQVGETNLCWRTHSECVESLGNYLQVEFFDC